MSSHSRHVWARAGALLTTAALLATGMFAIAPPSVAAVSTSIVISQVYGGGGNSGATFKNDFIELYNLGSATVDINGWTVQYASATGSSWQKTALAGTVEPGHYYLVQEAAGTGGAVDLPVPNAIGTQGSKRPAPASARIHSRSLSTNADHAPKPDGAMPPARAAWRGGQVPA